MTFSLHAQLENLANLLHLRRSVRLSHASRQQAYLNLLGAILDVPVQSLGELAPATVTVTTHPRIVSLPSRRSRVA